MPESRKLPFCRGKGEGHFDLQYDFFIISLQASDAVTTAARQCVAELEGGSGPAAKYEPIFGNTFRQVSNQVKPVFIIQGTGQNRNL
jgi:hypothetical protein